jgi:hypothetical protein
MNTYQEPKYEIKDGKLVNRQSGEAIPDDEPVFILRARDVHAVSLLQRYCGLVKDETQKEAAHRRCSQFSNWAALHRDRMKEPDTQLNDTSWSTAGTPPPIETQGS